MYTRRIINKVPGNIPAEPKKEKQGYIGDLSKKTIPQLNELLDRQIKILSNKSFINKLADKGEKIINLKQSIEEEIGKRNDNDDLSKMLSALSMNGKEDLDALEWTGHYTPGCVSQEDNISDDEQNPFKILATHSGAGFHKKKHRIIKPEEPLIKPSDIKNIDCDKNGETNEEILDEYAKHLCKKMDTVTNKNSKFLPFKTLRDTSKEEKKEPKKVNCKWEITAATPPPSVHGDTKLVSLQESLMLQYEQQQKLKEIQIKHAAERLAASSNFSVGCLPHMVGDYRDPASENSSDDENSENEVHDEEHPDGGGVTIYNLVDDHS